MVLLDLLDSIMTFADVAPFSDVYSPMKDVPIARCATAWTDPTDGITYILVFGQALYFGESLQHSLICPNQIRECNLNVVEDIPRKYCSSSSHSLIFRADGFVLAIPLLVDGVLSYFDTRKPTRRELDTCDHVLVLNSFHVRRSNM